MLKHLFYLQKAILLPKNHPKNVLLPFLTLSSRNHYLHYMSCLIIEWHCSSFFPVAKEKSLTYM